MSRTGYRTRFESLQSALVEAEGSRDSEALDRAQAELDAFVANIVSDARKLRAVAAESVACADEIRTRAADMVLPRQVLDPVHDPSFARLWLASLGDSQVTMLQRVLSDELSRRDLGGGLHRGYLRTA